MKKIGILGGTFNPPHCGHLSIAKDLLEEFSLDEILFLPAGVPPHKQNIDVASGEHRLKMLELLTSVLPQARVSALELEREGVTYTVDTLRALDRTAAEYYYIIGTDTLFQLTSWRSSEEVFRLTQFLCVPRPGEHAEEVAQRAEALMREHGAVIHLSKSVGPDISSTMIRERLRQKQSLAGLVPAEIEEYIKQNGIFGA